MSVAISIRLPDKIVNELDDLADSIDRSRTYIIRKAIESYMQEYADYLIALERLRDKDDKIISSDEMREKLGL
ncbi:MAG: DNA-binding protein [Thermoplasmata archaeon]|nr:MAG: DNA-binding protein [Thermoplasmata archaeon]RLF64090.1 MAG: DNA-binding protein [Thermoplasmata archaeon]